MNFKSNSAYKRWLAYGHANKLFENTPGNQPVSIEGKSKDVKHKMVLGGALYNTSKAMYDRNYIYDLENNPQPQQSINITKPEEDPNKKWTAAGTGALSGAASGAAIGGPWGAAIGGVVGGVSGYISNMKYGGMLSESMITHNGPSHEDGGIARKQGVELEGDEGEYNGLVFSNVNGYSDQFKKIKSRYKNRGKDDKLAKESMEREIMSLYQKQESDPVIIKGREKMMYGGKMKNGGDILRTQPYFIKGQYGIDPNTGLQQPTMQYDENGNLIPFQDTIGFLDMQGRGPLLPQNNNLNINDVEGYSVYNPSAINPKGLTTNNRSTLETSNQTLPGARMGNFDTPLDSYQSPRVPITGALLNSVGPAAQLVNSLINKEDDVNFERVNPELVNFDRTRNQMMRNSAGARRLNTFNVRNNARSSGQLLGNLASGNVAINTALNDQLMELAEREGNINTGIKNEANRINTGISNEEQIAKQQNKAAYRQAVYGALTDLGNIGAGYTRDNAMLDAQDIQNQRALTMMSSLPYRNNWYLDENGQIKLGFKS